MAEWIPASLAGFISGAAGALGLGGGGVLMIYLTVFAGVSQLTAQGVNLLFFIPCALVAVIMHAKNKLIRWQLVLPCVLLGLPGAAAGYYLSGVLGGKTLRIIFAVCLLLLGAKELFFPAKTQPADKAG